MRISALSITSLLIPLWLLSNPDTLKMTVDLDAETLEYMAFQAFRDSVDKALIWEHGTIDIGEGLAELEVPEGYKFLAKDQAEFLMTEVFGNVYEESLGLLVDERFSLMNKEDDFYFVEITYAEDGYIEDDDADDIDYDELLQNMKDDTRAESEKRVELGYESIEFVGWASPPYYDGETKKMHWAKELKFGGYESHTLNYNIRILGRRGYLIMNAIGDMSMLPQVQTDINEIIGSVHFNEGHRYEDFDPDMDKVAAYGIGGLVAGKLLAKAGFFALLAKFWKFIAIGLVAVFAAVRRFFGGSNG